MERSEQQKTAFLLYVYKAQKDRTNGSFLHHSPLSDHMEAASQKKLCQQRSFFSRSGSLV